MGTLHRRNGFYTVQAVCAIALHPPRTAYDTHTRVKPPSSQLVKAEKAIPLNRKIIICADLVSELLFLQSHYKMLQKCKYI